VDDGRFCGQPAAGRFFIGVPQRLERRLSVAFELTIDDLRLMIVPPIACRLRRSVFRVVGVFHGGTPLGFLLVYLRGLRALRGLSIAAGQRDCRVASLLAMT